MIKLLIITWLPYGLVSTLIMDCYLGNLTLKGFFRSYLPGFLKHVRTRKLIMTGTIMCVMMGYFNIILFSWLWVNKPEKPTSQEDIDRISDMFE